MAISLNGLANLYTKQGRHMEAVPLFQRTLHIWEQLEPEHPETAQILHALASFREAQGNG